MYLVEEPDYGQIVEKKEEEEKADHQSGWIRTHNLSIRRPPHYRTAATLIIIKRPNRKCTVLNLFNITLTSFPL